jgi:hypothetical protein
VSIAPISSSLSAFQSNAVQGNAKPIRQDFQNLATAPTSGDLAGAKEAFAAVQKLLQNPEAGKAGASQGGDKPQNRLSTDLVAIGKALISGDMVSFAKDSVNSLLGEIQAARGRSQPQAQGGEGAASSIASSTSASRPGGSKPVGSLINTTA